MTILKQTLRLEHKLGDKDVISSEIEFDFEDYDNYVEPLEEARTLLVNAISNGRPGIINKCRHALGMRYSQAEFNKDWQHYQQLCLDIDKVKKRITQQQTNLQSILGAEARLEDLRKILISAEVYEEFCQLLFASVRAKGSEELEKEVENFSHLQLPIVYPPEGEVEDKSN